MFMIYKSDIKITTATQRQPQRCGQFTFVWQAALMSRLSAFRQKISQILIENVRKG